MIPTSILLLLVPIRRITTARLWGVGLGGIQRIRGRGAHLSGWWREESRNGEKILRKNNIYERILEG